MKVDLISDLPPSIIELILMKVPIRDAVKTSKLSSKWRYKWTTIPNLEFNDNCVGPRSKSGFANFITYCLFLHEGPIHKFVLRSSFLRSSPVVDQWLLFLSRKGIKELSIELADVEWFKFHSCLFSCTKLTHLELMRCELEPPPSFKGFLFLKSLNLQRILIPSDAIQRLISSCPLLETLLLWTCGGLKLTIWAPNLKYLNLDGEYKDIYLENTPLLISVTVATYMSDYPTDLLNCNFDKFFCRIPCLERLVGQIYFTKYLSIGIEGSSMSIKHDHLKSIELDQISFEDMDELLVLLRLIVNSPNLEELNISGCYNSSTDSASPEWSFWEKECPKEYMFSQLKSVRLSDMFGEMNEMEFIKLILERAPVLEAMTIIPSSYAKEGALNMLIALARYRRASAQAELIFLQKEI